MAKRVAIEFVESGVTAIAEVQENDAPKTTTALWASLAQPIETTGIHAMWAGREIVLDVPETNQVFDPEAIPLENATVYPAAGDICWGYFPPCAERGFAHGIWNVAIRALWSRIPLSTSRSACIPWQHRRASPKASKRSPSARASAPKG